MKETNNKVSKTSGGENIDVIFEHFIFLLTDFISECMVSFSEYSSTNTVWKV